MFIHLIQNNPVWGEHRQSLAKLDRLMDLVPDKPGLIVLPEMFATGFHVQMDHSEILISARETREWMEHQAKAKNSLIVGSMAVVENNKVYNRCYCIAPSAVIEYNKRHLFSMSEEPQCFSSGSEQVVFEWQGWNIMPIVCYDLRFPVWCRNFPKNPYDLLVCVASWPVVRKDVWLTLLKARAMENQSYVVGVNRTGADGNGLEHQGDSIIYSPKGEIIGQLSYQEGVESFEISLDPLKKFREKFPVLNDADHFIIPNTQINQKHKIKN